MIHQCRYLFVKKKVFNLSEQHFSEVAFYKIHTLEFSMYCTKCHSEISNCGTYQNFFDDQLSFHSMPSLPLSFKCCQTSNSISLTLCSILSLNSKFNLQFAILAFAMHVLCLFLSDGKFYAIATITNRKFYSLHSRNLSNIALL